MQPALDLAFAEVLKENMTSYSFRGLEGPHARCNPLHHLRH